MNKPQSLFLLSALFATMAFLLSAAGYFRCQFIQFTSDSSPSITVSFGIWYHQSLSVAKSAEEGHGLHSSCVQYPNGMDVDASWKAARGFSILAFIFGLFFVIVNVPAMCMRPHKAKSIIGPGYVLAAIFEGLSLLFLNSNACKNNGMMEELVDSTSKISSWADDLDFPSTCSISTGAKSTIAAMVLYFAASVMSCLARASEKEEEEISDAGTDCERAPSSSSLTDPFLTSEARQASIFLHPSMIK